GERAMKRAFSYSAGERGRNRVRIGTDRRTGVLYIAWMEDGPRSGNPSSTGTGKCGTTGSLARSEAAGDVRPDESQDAGGGVRRRLAGRGAAGARGAEGLRRADKAPSTRSMNSEHAETQNSRKLGSAYGS